MGLAMDPLEPDRRIHPSAPFGSLADSILLLRRQRLTTWTSHSKICVVRSPTYGRLAHGSFSGTVGGTVVSIGLYVLFPVGCAQGYSLRLPAALRIAGRLHSLSHCNPPSASCKSCVTFKHYRRSLIHGEIMNSQRFLSAVVSGR